MNKKNLTLDETFALAVQNYQNNNFKIAENLYKEILEKNPDHFESIFCLGSLSIQTKNFDTAILLLNKAIQIKSNHANAYHNLGLVFKILGKFKEATNSYQKSLKCDPKNLIVLYDLSELKEEVLDIKLKSKINKIMNSGTCTKKNLAYGYFLLAKYELYAKSYNKEFNYLIKGHQCYFESESKNFNKGINYWLNELPKNKELFNLNKFNKNIKKINYKIKPIFIIGFPRCGSTLVEKIIASSQEYIPTGEETNVLNALIGQRLLQKKSLISDIENFQIKLFESYQKKGLIKKKNDYTFTDKTLDNFFFLGLIKEIFPYARVIHCRRNALSSIMSIIKNNLRTVSWAHNLKHIFEFFDIYYRVVQKFKKMYPNFIYELEYEKLVNDPEIESKKLMKYCGLSWDKKCLEFYKRKDLISQTASNIQIRKAIYKDSIKKYAPYKKLLSKYGDKYFWFN